MPTRKIALFVLFLFMLVIISNVILTRLTDTKPATSPLDREKKTPVYAVREKTASQQTTTEDRFNVRSKADIPRTQGQWDAFMAEVVERSGMMENNELQKKLKEKIGGPENQQHSEKIVLERIDTYERMLIEDPSNQAVEDRLQKLYRMRALQKIFHGHTPSPVSQ